MARDIDDPVRGKSVLDAWQERQRTRSSVLPDSSFRADTAFALGALGSGSDYTVFIDHITMPSMNVSYGGEQSAGVYHSIYDTYDFFARFQDTTFAYGVAEAQTTGTLLLRLADAPVLPFEFTNVARTYTRYVEEIEKAAAKNDTTRALDLKGVRAALQRVQRAAASYEQAVVRVEAAPSATLRRRARELREINRLLYTSEQALSDDAGLPGREWYRHLIYAPGFYTGYGVKTMPGIREAVEDRPNLEVAQREAVRVAAALDRYAAQIERAGGLLERLVR